MIFQLRHGLRELEYELDERHGSTLRNWFCKENVMTNCFFCDVIHAHVIEKVPDISPRRQPAASIYRCAFDFICERNAALECSN